MSRCIFCEGGTSDEHILAQWLIRDCELDSQPIELGVGAEQGGRFEFITEKQPLRKFLLTSICVPCNTGWMSRLENTTKDALTPFLQLEWPLLDAEPLEALVPFCRDLTLWMLKTAVTFGTKMSVPIPQYVIRDLRHGIIYPGVVLDLACSELSGTYVAITKQWNVVVNGNESVRQNPDGFRLTWQIRHLILRVSYFPYTARLQLKPRYPVVLYPIFKIVPPYESRSGSGIITYRKRYVYADVRQFEHETTYYKTAAPDPVLEGLNRSVAMPW